MRSYVVKKNPDFVGREQERDKLLTLADGNAAAIVVVHGRRRAGKTELIEQTLGEQGLLKFEGREDQPPELQRKIFLETLAFYCEEPPLASLNADSWRPILQLLADRTKAGKWTIFLEEFQWLCNYQSELISELKYIWDNSLRHNPNLLLILCGSSPSFMIRKVVHSKALHNRSQHEIALKPFSLAETGKFLGERFPDIEALNAHLAVGGIPEYLKYIRSEGATIPGLAKNSFLPESFFSTEKKRVFVSALADNRHYEEIVNLLAQIKFSTRDELIDRIGINSGGSISTVLSDLDACGFIRAYTPFDSPIASTNVRYQITDNYLQYYFRFIDTRLKEIANGSFRQSPTSALNMQTFEQWLGYALERLCQVESHQIARVLEFSGISYRSGQLFRRGSASARITSRSYQIDLIFERADRVYTLCEIKHNRSPIDQEAAAAIVEKFEKAPLKKKYSRQRVLITTGGATTQVQRGGYFDKIIGLDELLKV